MERVVVGRVKVVVMNGVVVAMGGLSVEGDDGSDGGEGWEVW